jgi:predicted ribosomally synthesized peptide with nif11-like leader
MSKAEVERFADDVRSNEALKAEVIAAGADEAKVSAFAKGKGYDFTAAELKEYADAKKGELSEEDLDKVAGGGATQVQTNVEVQAEVAVQAVEAQSAATTTTVAAEAEVVICAT